MLEEAGLTADRLPVVVLRSGEILVDPTNIDLANALGADAARCRACTTSS